MKPCCPTCGKELSTAEIIEIQRDYESALDLLAYDIRIQQGIDPVTAVEIAKKKLREAKNNS